MCEKVLMTCGHIANGTTLNGKPYCIICNCNKVAEQKPNLTGRFAKCVTCSNITESNYNLPFFEYKPDSEEDEYYCGCLGWD